MERICRECGSLVSGEARFCPVCGKPMERAVDLGKHDDNMPAQPVQPAQPGVVINVPVGNEVGSASGYGAPQYGVGGVPQINNTQTNNIAYEHMSTGEWFLTIAVCTLFGIISLILNIVWGFGSTTPEPKRSFCKAMFIMNIVSMVLGVIVAGIFSWIIAEGMWSI